MLANSCFSSLSRTKVHFVLYSVLYFVSNKIGFDKIRFLIDRSCVKERCIHRVFSVKKSKEIKGQLIFVIRNIVNIKINVQKTALQID